MKKCILVLMLLIIIFTACKNEEVNSVTQDEFINQLKLINQELTNISNNNETALQELGGKIMELDEKINDLIAQPTVNINRTDRYIDKDTEEYISILEEELKFDVFDPGGRMYYQKDKVLDEKYSVDRGKSAVSKIRSILRSFEVFHEFAYKIMTEEEYDTIMNHADFNAPYEVEMVNNMIFIDGTIRDQEFIISKLNFSLAIEKYKDREITLEELESAMDYYIATKAKYEEFIETASFGD